MKKFTLLVTLMVITLVALGVTGIAFAHGPNPRPTDPLGNNGMMGGSYGMMGGGYGMMGGGYGMMGGGYGFMHEYMVTALADSLGLTPESLDEQLAAGKTMWDIAREQGLTDAEITDLMYEAHENALEQAVADGVLTQEQAEWMDEHMMEMGDYMLEMHTNGYGLGSCHGGNGTTSSAARASLNWSRMWR